MKLWIRVVLDHQKEKDSEKSDVQRYFEAEAELEVLPHAAVLINDHRYCVHAIVMTRQKENQESEDEFDQSQKHPLEEG